VVLNLIAYNSTVELFYVLVELLWLHMNKQFSLCPGNCNKLEPTCVHQLCEFAVM
jgi:hypothetical protein